MFENELELFQRSKQALWTDEYIGKSLLNAHLDESSNEASRKHEIRIKTENWINGMIKPNSKILDLGCGPGLYSYELGKAGHYVRGIDFNRKSIQFANKNKRIKNNVEYEYKNYLEDKIAGKYDVIIMIYCDFGALIPKEQEILLQKIKELLEDDGIFIFDVFYEITNSPKEGKNWSISRGNDFWSKEPYFMMEETKIFDNIIGRRYIIINQNNKKTKEIILWDHYYHENEIREMLNINGFDVKEINKKILEEMEDKVMFVISGKAAENRI